ncbi:hypothetical protein DPMN_152572 [Dreissena polymorpha]|uniref:Uncharacterized protein n=1 Tax=Dreissena polymorpha TaxID=45954 RepID=A0A9D4FHH9_DREPO|nr:hypothetical protein DPMN_152572 [Dreissena polymorpha]
MTWPACHAHLSQSHLVKAIPSDILSVLPLFQEEAKSAAILRHSMTIIKACVNFLNPGQIPVMACDQPLYALAKNIQWNWPERYGDNLIVVMFGCIYIEIAALRTIGDWLHDSGWVNALSQSNVASAGTADSFLKSLHHN